MRRMHLVLGALTAVLAGGVSGQTANTTAAFFDDFGDAAGACGWEPRPSGGLGHSAASGQQAVDDGTGNCALAFGYPATAIGRDSHQEHRFSFGERRREVWIEYDWFVPANFWMRNDRPANNKFFRIFTADGNPPSLAITTEYAANVIVGREEGTAYMRRALIDAESWAWWPQGERPPRSDHRRFIGPDSTYLIQPGTWAKVRMQFRTSSAPRVADGWIYRDVDGVVIQDNAWAIVNKRSMTDRLGFDMMYLMGWSNNGFDEPTAFYIDNLTVHFTNPGWGR